MSIMDTPFDAADFEATWDRVRHFTGSRWIDASAIEQSMARNAVCLVCPDGVVSIALEVADSGRMRALVLIAVSTRFAGAFRRNEGHVIEIARSMGAATLAFRSRRRGWATC